MSLENEIGFLHGNLLDFPYGITSIAHCCNTMNVTGAGIAKSIHDDSQLPYKPTTNV